jgi:hypothetical protein
MDFQNLFSQWIFTWNFRNGFSHGIFDMDFRRDFPLRELIVFYNQYD